MLVVTFFGIASQGTNFITQIIVAAAFGARPDNDALLAANTLPQYISAVFLGALSVVFIPVFIDYRTRGEPDEAWNVTSGILTLCVLICGFTLGGVLFAKPLLQLTVQGLAPSTLDLAAKIAVFAWPSILGTGLFGILAGLYQAEGHFGWQAIASLIGSIANLIMAVILIPIIGASGVALALTLSMLLQVALVLRIVFGRFRFGFNLRHPGVRQVIVLLIPLFISGFAVRWTPVVDRFLVSGLGTGSISHLGYAFRLVELASLFLSTGLGVVIFPRMAQSVSSNNLGELRQTVSLSLRMMWLAIAPISAIGAALALPAIHAVFQRGQFTAADLQAVADLMRIYLMALAGMALGSITGRTFYALKATRIIAVIGIAQSLLYIVYTGVLVYLFGIAGAACGYVLYFNGSLLWQMVLIRRKMGGSGGRRVIISFARTGLAAALGAFTAYALLSVVRNVWLQLILGGLGGAIIYGLALVLLGSPEARALIAFGMERIGKRT